MNALDDMFESGNCLENEGYRVSLVDDESIALCGESGRVRDGAK